MSIRLPVEITAQNIYSILKDLPKVERRNIEVCIYDRTNEEEFKATSVQLTSDGKLLFIFE